MNTKPSPPELPRELQQSFLLLFLSRGRSHGYELAEALRSHHMPVDLATVYRRLRTMERSGLIAARWEESPAGPPRRVYDLTSSGEGAARVATASMEALAAMLLEAIATPAKVAASGD